MSSATSIQQETGVATSCLLKVRHAAAPALCSRHEPQFACASAGPNHPLYCLLQQGCEAAPPAASADSCLRWRRACRASPGSCCWPGPTSEGQCWRPLLGCHWPGQSCWQDRWRKLQPPPAPLLLQGLRGKLPWGRLAAQRPQGRPG